MRQDAPRRDDHGGFALIEVMLALVLIAVLAALALPGLKRATGPAALRVAALRVSAVLREDRNVAQGAGRTVSTAVEFGGRRILSGASSATVGMPPDATASISGDPARTIRFFANGRSSGGSILIAAPPSRYLVTVNRDTGAIRVIGP